MEPVQAAETWKEMRDPVVVNQRNQPQANWSNRNRTDCQRSSVNGQLNVPSGVNQLCRAQPNGTIAQRNGEPVRG